MPTKRKSEGKSESDTGAFPRVERLLAMILLGQQPGAATGWEKIGLLRSAGLTNTEIGEMLGMSGLVVGKTFYDATKRRSPKKKKGKQR